VSGPTLDQLLNLANRAEYKGGLTAAEATRLREGLRAGDAARRSAGGLQRALKNERAQVRELEAAARLVAATAEVIEANGLTWAADSVRRALTGSLDSQAPAGAATTTPDAPDPTRDATGATQAAGGAR
jgi:hypothetical protein